MKLPTKKEDRKILNDRLMDLWNENEEAGSGEMASYHIACGQLGIDPDDGWDLLAEFGEEIKNEPPKT